MSNPTNSTDGLRRQILELLIEFEHHREKTGIYEDWTLAKKLIDLFTAHTQAIQAEARIDEIRWAMEYHKSTPNPPLANEYFKLRLAQLTTKPEEEQHND